jgi:hypothetical protein
VGRPKLGDGQGAGHRQKYKLLVKQRPNGTVADSSKRLTSRFYQLKTGHCLTGQYLNWTKSRLSFQY